jgi:Holliday junction resolvase RusA-like endonuclease
MNVKRKIDLCIIGEPVAQGRPRFSTANGFARAYDPVKSRDAKSYVRIAAVSQMKGVSPFCGPVGLSLRVFRTMPKSFSKRKQEAAERGDIMPITKPDLDNYLKLVKDALKGVCWIDDSAVVRYIEPFEKRYSVTPRIEITVYAYE